MVVSGGWIEVDGVLVEVEVEVEELDEMAPVVFVVVVVVSGVGVEAPIVVVSGVEAVEVLILVLEVLNLKRHNTLPTQRNANFRPKKEFLSLIFVF